MAQQIHSAGSTRPPTAVALLVLAAAVTSLGAQPAPDRAALTASIDALSRDRGVEVSVVARRLDAADAFALRGEVVFHAASTMKVPVMIELYRQAAEGRVPLDTPVPVVNEFRSVVDGSPFTLSAEDDSEPTLYAALGQPRPARELCALMITRSSNLATNLLIDRLGVERIQETVERLGGAGMTVRRKLEDGKAYEQGLNNTTTARGLAALMEAIASGRAVSPAASREMVEILKRQAFRDGIPAGLPPGTVVAHKTGEISSVNHDAAIIFGPHPYVLVVLVRGRDASVREPVIAEVARQVHLVLARP
jgi:beta-lactamase class A